MIDDYTMEMRLCDDAGMVSDTPVEPGSPGTVINPDLTYLKLLNNLRARTGPLGEHKPVTEPFTCTGSAHLAGEHIRCTNRVHRVGRQWAQAVLADPARASVEASGMPDDDLAALREAFGPKEER